MRGSTRVYQCRWRGCLRTFADSSNVRRHENVHLGLKSFVCPVADCRKAFTRKAAAQIHIDTAHSGDGGADMVADAGSRPQGLVQCRSKQEIDRRLHAELVKQAQELIARSQS